MSEARRNGLLRWLAVILAAAIVLVLPRPEALEPKAWRLLAVFAATMVGLITQPLPGSAMVLLGISAVALLGLAPVGTALAGYSDPVVWLVLAAFMISRAMIKTGLGRRIAFHFIRKLGNTSLGLAYALGFSEMALGSIIPSTGARSGGVIFPIAKSIAEAYESYPGESARKLGAFLMLFLYNTNVIVCAMFLTGQASNALIASFASNTTHVDMSYTRWLIGGIIPGLMSFALAPMLVYKLCPPEIKRTPLAAEKAREELQRIGPMTLQEKYMAGTFALVLVLWLTQALHKIDYVAVALLGVAVLLLTKVLDWEDVITEKRAWDVFLWYGGLVELAKLLGDSGITKWFATSAGAAIGGWTWIAALVVLSLIYFYAHYGFASITAHATAMYVPFLTVCVAAGAPPVLATLVLAYISNLSATLTHYGTTPAPIYFGAGYVSQREWWRVGLATSFVNLLVWATIGVAWWRFLGWWR